MTNESVPRVWLNPPKFWAATRSMSKDEAERFFAAITRLAEDRNFEALRKFDFIQVGHSYRNRPIS